MDQSSPRGRPDGDAGRFAPEWVWAEMAAARFDEDLGRSERYPDFRPICCALLAQVKRTSAAGFLPVWGHTDLEFFNGREVFTGSGQDCLLPLSVTTYRDRYYVRRGDNRRVLAEVVLDTVDPLKAAEALAGLIETGIPSGRPAPRPDRYGLHAA